MEHHLTMNNLGTLGFIMIIILLLFVVTAIFSCCKSIKCCEKVYRRLESALYYNIILRTIMESFVIGVMCTLINLKQIDFSMDDRWTFANTVITIILSTIYALFPIFAALYMLGNWELISHQYIKSRFGEIYQGFSTQSK